MDRRDIQLSAREIASILAPYINVRLSEAQLAQISTYLQALKKWNEVVPLTALEDEAEIVSRHFGESMFGGSVVSMNSGRLADVGTGAGFPGLALKIVFPGLEITLIEPNMKKCAFLREVIHNLELKDVEIARCTYEEFAPSQPWDYICSRALGNYKPMLHWSRNFVAPNGRIVLWLGLDDSIAVSKVKNWQWDLPIAVPESKRRVILVGRPS